MPSYLAMIRNPGEGIFSVDYPDLPGCSATTDTFPGARKMAGSLLAGYLRELQASGQALPPPRSMRELADSGLSDGAVPTLIPVPEEDGLDYLGI